MHAYGLFAQILLVSGRRTWKANWILRLTFIKLYISYKMLNTLYPPYSSSACRFEALQMVKRALILAPMILIKLYSVSLSPGSDVNIQARLVSVCTHSLFIVRAGAGMCNFTWSMQIRTAFCK